MALDKKGSTVYANIADLPLITDIRDGDMFIVQTSSGTKRFDYKSLLIPLSKTSFQANFNDMSNLYSNSNVLLNKIGDATITVTSLPANNATLSDAVNQLSKNIDTVNTTLGSKINSLSVPVGSIITILDDPDSTDISEKAGYLPMKGQDVPVETYRDLYNYLLNHNLITGTTGDYFTMPECETTTSVTFKNRGTKTGYYYIKY